MMPGIPVVLASGRMDEAVAEELKTLGVVRCLDKPFTEVQLAEVLKGFLAAPGASPASYAKPGA